MSQRPYIVKFTERTVSTYIIAAESEAEATELAERAHGTGRVTFTYEVLSHEVAVEAWAE